MSMLILSRPSCIGGYYFLSEIGCDFGVFFIGFSIILNVNMHIVWYDQLAKWFLYLKLYKLLKNTSKK